MTSKRYFFVLIGTLVLLLAIIIGGTVSGNIVLQKQSEKLLALKSENETIEMQQNALIQAKKYVERYSELDTIARSVVPQDKDQAKTVREIVKIAQENRIPIKSISFETSNLGAIIPKAPAASPEESGNTPPPSTPAQPSDRQRVKELPVRPRLIG